MWGVWLFFCFVVHYLVSSFAIISLEKKESRLLYYFNCILMSFDSYQCSVSLPHGAVVWSTLWDRRVS